MLALDPDHNIPPVAALMGNVELTEGVGEYHKHSGI